MPSAHQAIAASPRWQDPAAVACVLVVLLVSYAQAYLPLLPNAAGRIAGDYTLFLPDLLAGYYWFLHNGVFSIPWFSPAQCGGVPYFPDPQVGFYALPQWLTFVMSPLRALQTSFMVFAAAGFVGAYGLVRVSFCGSMPAAMLAGALFMFNGFYSSRMLVGHLTFHAFMLLPLLAACLLPRGGARVGVAAAILRIGVAGGCVGYMIQSGMFHILPPALLSLAVVAACYAYRHGWRWFPVAGLAGALAVGLALGGGKLAATLAFVASFPRSDYPLPGIASLWSAAVLVFRTVFFAVPADAQDSLSNVMWAQSQHEWEYGVSPAPLALMLGLAAVRTYQRRWPRLTGGRVALLIALGVMLAIPVAVNWYEPAWNALLKSLPFFGSSSNLLRWFCVYILPAVLGGAFALDGLCAALALTPNARATLAATGIAALLLLALTRDLAYYGEHGTGSYDVATIQDAYARARATGAVPPVDAVVVLLDQAGHVLTTPQRDDTMTRGHSQMLCYQPLFGYRLEHFPVGALHPGRALEQSRGALNFKNPACYVFPRQNGCLPGDPFAAGAEADARALLDYRPYGFAAPLYATAANWVSQLAFFAWVCGTLAAAAALVRAPGRERAVAAT